MLKIKETVRSLSLPMIVAVELDADWSKVRVEGAPVAPVYTSPVDNAQGVGGSSSIRNEYEPLARTGAMARAMLVAAAAAEWKVDPQTCRTENGHVLHADGRKLFYGKLAEAASRIPPPKAVTLKDPKAYKLVGRPTKRLDSLEKTSGKALFGPGSNRGVLGSQRQTGSGVAQEGRSREGEWNEASDFSCAGRA